MAQKIYLISLFVFFNISYSLAQVLPMTLENAEKCFLEKNLSLLIEHYNIDAASAQIIQARLFDNPNISFEQNIYNSRNGRYFDFGSEGETTVEIEQLIYLAGKRKKRVELEKVNTEIAGYQFQEVLRELRSNLRNNFIELFYIQKSIVVYDKEISNLTSLVNVYEEQFGKGNISRLEKSRLKALLFALQNEKTTLIKEQINARKEIGVLLNVTPETEITPQLNTSKLQQFSFQEIPFSRLLSEIQNRSDLKLSEANIRSNNANYRLQKSMQIPDLNIKGIWDKDGNFIHNYFAIGISVDLPFFNRNQGNIKTAKAQWEQSKIAYENHEKTVVSELHAEYQRAEESLILYQTFDHSIEQDFNQLINGVTKNFEQRNISMLEFIDYYETYKNTCLQLYEVEKTMLLGIESLNYTIGKNLFDIIQ